jgi:hypothetical protein
MFRAHSSEWFLQELQVCSTLGHEGSYVEREFVVLSVPPETFYNTSISYWTLHSIYIDTWSLNKPGKIEYCFFSNCFHSFGRKKIISFEYWLFSFIRNFKIKLLKSLQYFHERTLLLWCWGENHWGNHRGKAICGASNLHILRCAEVVYANVF